MFSAQTTKKTFIFNMVIKRQVRRIEKMVRFFLKDALKLVANTNGDLTKKRRDEFADGLVQFITDNWKEIFEPILAKIEYRVKDINITLYKENANWTEIFILITINIGSEKIRAGLIVELVVRDIFVSILDKAVLAEIVADEKRPKRFYHHQTIYTPQ